MKKKMNCSDLQDRGDQVYATMTKCMPVPQIKAQLPHPMTVIIMTCKSLQNIK